MTRIFNKTKKMICAIALAFFMTFTSGFGLLLQNLNVYQVEAAANPTEISITNSDFFDTKVTGEVISPSSWESLNKSENVISGVISTNQKIFEKHMKDDYLLNFKPYKYEGMNDEQILMINSKSKQSNSGFKSPSFSLEKSSYYKISFKALTENSNFNDTPRYAHGSATLVGEGFKNLSESTISINTTGNWLEYTFYVATNTINNVDTALELWLGYENGVQSYGAIFFDSIKIYKLDEELFKISTQTINNKQTKICNLNTLPVLNVIDNNEFENIIETENTNKTGWKILTENNSNANNINNYAGLAFVNDSFSSEEYKLDVSPTNANLYGNTKALLINNKEASSIGFESNLFEIKQHTTYKISLFVKSNVTTGKAEIKLVEENPYPTNEDFDVKVFKVDANTQTLKNEKTNDWIEYSIYIKGRNYENTKAKLQLWLGTKEEKAVGYAFFDHITMNQITTDNYKSGSGNSNVLTADFSAPKNTITIPNGNFNLVEQNDLTKTYPYGVQNWINKSNNKNQTLSGIINTSDTSMIPTITNPTSGNVYSNNNNILMIGNVGTNSQTYTTDNTITLAANKYYELSFMIQTQKLSNGAKAGFRLFSSTMTLKELMYIESNNVWTTYKLYIKSASTDTSANIELSLGNKNNGSGYVFFDNVMLSETTNEIYDNVNQDKTNIKVNLFEEDFTNTSNKTINGLLESNSYNASSQGSTIKHGVLDTTNPELLSQYFPGMENPQLPENKSGNVLMISSNEDSYFFYTSKNSFTLTNGNFYKISVYVKTNKLSQKDINKVETNVKNEYYPYGASITLTSIEKSFTGVNTNNEWKDYSFYINATEDATVQIRLALGLENAKTTGDVFFSTVLVEKIEEDAYYTAIKPLETDDTIDNIMAVGSTEAPKKEDEEEKTNNEINFDWLVVPTLISSLALIIAMVGLAIKKFSKKIPHNVKIKVGEYDRDKTLEKEFEHREAIRKQQEKLNALKQNLEEVKFEIEDSKAEFRKEEKQHKIEVKKQVKEKKVTLSKTKDNKSKKETNKEIKSFKQQQRDLFNQEKRAKYEEKQKQLKEKFALIELEIQAIYEEELKLIKAYKEYRKQVKIKKKELRQQKKNDKILNKDK